MDVQAVATGATTQPQEVAAPAQAGAGAAASSDAGPLHADGALAPVVAKLLGHGDMPHPLAVNVSYRVEHDPNIIVTVFTDPNTGAEIAQAPPEVMVQIAQFFDKQSGVTLDRSV